MIVLGLLACEPFVIEDPLEDDDPPMVSVRALWDLGADPGTVTVTDGVVSSPRTITDQAFYVQHPAGGPASGLRVEVDAVLDEWPPAVGTPVELTGTWRRDDQGPVLVLVAAEDGRRVGEPVAFDPTPWSDREDLAQTLVSIGPLTVTSALDPAGHADADVPAGIGALFGIGPGFGRTGTLVGLWSGGRVSARTSADWSGDLAGDDPSPATLAELDDLPDGTPVRMDDLVMATPWDRARRFALLQDAGGEGLWVDTEAWHVEAQPGDVAEWTGEIRQDEAGRVLRSWTDPRPSGTARAATESSALVHGALARTTATGLGPPDRLGEIPTAEGPLLDDRFIDLGFLEDPADVLVAVRGGDPMRWAVVEGP